MYIHIRIRGDDELFEKKKKIEIKFIDDKYIKICR